jgi:diacylglycerol kinase family enzyme
MFLGGLERSRGYRRLAGPTATVTAGAPLPVHCDGDPAGAAERVEIELRPRALEIVVPAATASDADGPFAAW